jgi:ribosomal-protein-alanine N-acetyltransferase
MLNAADLPVVARQFSDPEMCTYFSEPPCTMEQAEAIIDHYRNPEGQDHLRYGLFDKRTDSFVGTCGYHYLDLGCRQVEIGYDIWKEYWRQGYASEAVAKLIAICFDFLPVDCVYVLVHPGNRASLATARKLGFAACEPRRAASQEQVCLELTRQTYSTATNISTSTAMSSGSAAAPMALLA